MMNNFLNNCIDGNFSQDQTREYQVHQDYLRQAYKMIQQRYPQLEIELYFVTLASEFQRISPR
jgi:hypothetical protein